MKKKKKKKPQKVSKAPAVRDTQVAARGTAFGLPIPTTAQHQKAVKEMAPYLEEFQRAADEQTRKDFGPGIVGKVTRIIVPGALRKKLAEE
jgi:hypothetical protein